jgi:monovalent cation/proton antiporter MnhG/PhaG subunit
VSPAHAVSTAFLVLGSLVLVLASVGAALPRNPFVRLHYLSLSALVGAPLVVLGVLVRDPGDWFKLVLVVVLIAATSPVAGAATARALERREQEPEGSR